MIGLVTSRMTKQILLLLTLEFSGASWVQASGHQEWSIDLTKYGYQEWRESSGMGDSSELRLAAANNLVAVGLGNPSNKTQVDARSSSGKWEISLFLFDQNTGKLRSKCGPWSGDRFFELFSTSRGNLILLVRNFHQTTGETGETMYLLSPAGVELKKLVLAPSFNRAGPDWNGILISSSGRTALVAQRLEDGVHYKTLEADTVALQSEWTDEVASNPPSVVALSDTEVLGLRAFKAAKKEHSFDRATDLYIRGLASTWNRFPAELDLTLHGVWFGLSFNQLAFLSDDSVVGVSPKHDDKQATVVVLHTDGSTIFSPVIPKVEPNTSLSGPVAVTQDGHYFAVGFEHRPWLSHLMLDVWQMDMAFQWDELLFIVWGASWATPVAKFNLGSEADVRAFSLMTDDPLSLALLGKGTLKVVRPQRLH